MVDRDLLDARPVGLFTVLCAQQAGTSEDQVVAPKEAFFDEAEDGGVSTDSETQNQALL